MHVPKAVEQDIYKTQFYEYGNFPGTNGCIDGCHMPKRHPAELNYEKYRNRKNWFSIKKLCTSKLLTTAQTRYKYGILPN